MSYKFKLALKMFAGLCMAFSLVTASQAAMPEPAKLKDTVSMSFDQRLAHLKSVNDAILKSTPQEISAYWLKIAAQISSLSAADKKYIQEKMQENWKATTLEQKKAFRDQRLAFINAMTPNQRAAAKAYLDGSRPYQSDTK